MKLKKITLFGFKSFPHKTVIEFNNGFNAIVGPNGIGKSNIIDAIKWVVGEKSIRELRGEKLEDVIFFGSEGKNPMNLAEVEIVFENNGLIPLEFEDVVVKRRYFRDGTSEFYINNTPCRLKDIVEKFANTGISYCIVDDNSIKRIILSDSKIRRELFESIANIGKYREDKKEAVAKLNNVEEELSKLNAILEEKEKNARILQYQARRASQYKDIIKELKEKIFLAGCNEIFNIEENIKRLNELNEELGKKIKNVALKKEELLKEREETQRKIDEKNLYLKEINDKIKDYENKNLNIVQEIARIEAIIENIEKTINEIKVGDIDLERQKELLEEKRKILSLKEEEYYKSKEKQNKLGSNIKEIESKINYLNFEEIRKKDRLNDREKILNETLIEDNEMEKDFKSLEASLFNLIKEKEDIDKKIEENTRILNEKNNEKEGLFLKKSNLLRIKEQIVKNKIELEEELLKLKSNYEENKREFCERFGLRRLSDIVKIKEGYSALFEGALDILEDALIGSKDKVLEAYFYAKEKNINDIVFIIEENLKERIKEGEIFKYIEKDDENILGKILDTFSVAEKLDDEILEKSERIVTIDGDVYNDGIIRMKRGKGFLVLKENIMKISRDIDKLEKEIVLKEIEISDIHKMEKRLDEEIKDLKEIRNDLTSRKSNIEFEIARIEIRKENYTQDLKKKKRNIEEIKKEINEIENSLIEINNKKIKLEEEKKKIMEEFEENEKILKSLNENIATISNEVSEYKNIINNAQKVLELKGEIEEKFNYLNEKKGELLRIKNELDVLIERSNRLNEEINGLRKKLEENFILIEETERENLNLVSENKLIVKEIEDNKKKKEELFQKVWRETEKTPEPLKIDNIENIEEEIKRLNEKKERFGEVNPLAEEDYRIVKEEIDSMKEKIDDLVNARIDILNTIKKIDSNAEGIFVKTIQEIRKNFQLVFERFFENGFCDIRLVGTDPLSADIEIIARPPGKKIRQLESLSEGEKTITAFSLLLGVILTKKSGILILDEIDAPLDEKNIERFISVIRTLFNDGQIIIITHNRRTMDEADYIFGVTMEEKGVSKILSMSKEVLK
uniref:Chromosome segregation protein SMC n=1 Tax=candidate division WOR-3 bacterium TaxID=2052148 RepID=A0A7C4YG52_UNCW3